MSKRTVNKLDVNNTDTCGQCERELMGQKEAPRCEGPCKTWFHVKCEGICAGELDVLARKNRNVV